jgi:hypothetical protein
VASSFLPSFRTFPVAFSMATRRVRDSVAGQAEVQFWPELFGGCPKLPRYGLQSLGDWAPSISSSRSRNPGVPNRVGSPASPSDGVCDLGGLPSRFGLRFNMTSAIRSGAYCEGTVAVGPRKGRNSH